MFYPCFLHAILYLLVIASCGRTAHTPPDCVLMGLGCETMRGVTPSAQVCIFQAAPPSSSHIHARLFSPPLPTPRTQASPQHHGLRPCRHRLRRGLLGHSLPSHLHRYVCVEVQAGNSLFYLWGVVGWVGVEIQRVSDKQASTPTRTHRQPARRQHTSTCQVGPEDPLPWSGRKLHRG